MEEAVARQARRGKRRERTHAAAAGLRSERYRHLTNPFPPMVLFSDDRVEAIHQSALRVLEELGIVMLLPEARTLLAAAGASVDGALVRFDRGLVEQALATAPKRFVLRGAGAESGATFAPASVVFGPVGGAPHASDLQGGRRPGSLEDFKNFLRLAESFAVLHIITPMVEPQDVPVNLRHLAMMEWQMRLTTKPPFVYARGAQQVRDSLQTIRLARGLDEDAFAARPHAWTVINTNSPRQLDRPMLSGILDFARAGQISVITPFTLSGAMAPITIPGALVLQHAEFLAGLVVAQTARPGAPVVYGAFTSNVDMRSGSPAFGTPEYVHACFGAGQLARHLGLPWRSSLATTANTVDAQAAYETQMSLWGAVLGGANLFMHSAGWMEGGLTASFEKFVVDVECLQMMAEIMQPRAAEAEDLAFEAIAAVESGGHFFAAQHTMARYQSAFYEPLVSDRSNFGRWQETGSSTAMQRAAGVVEGTLAAYAAPPLDAAAGAAMEDFLERRRREGGAPTD